MAKKAPRAPAGAKKILTHAANFIKRNGAEEAAKYLKVSEATARKVQRAIETGKPLGSIITSRRGLNQWKDRVKEAPRLKKNREAFETIKAQAIPIERIAQQSGLSRREVQGALSSMQYRTSDPDQAPAIRKAIEELRPTLPQYSENGFVFNPGGIDQARSIPGAEKGYIFKTGFRDLSDIDEYLDVVFGSAREFFMIVQMPPDSRGKIRYSAFDIRPPGVREMPKNYKGLVA